MKKYVTSKEMQELDRQTIEVLGIPSIVLMENAGCRAHEEALSMLAEDRKGKVVCVCGKGNNGGDGFVCARHLINQGVSTEVFLIGESTQLRGDAKINYAILKKLGAKIKTLKCKDDFSLFRASLSKADLLIDAIFGVGLSGEVGEPYRGSIDLMNQSKVSILAIDVPSGLDATSGKILGVCVAAKKTITFVLPKTGFIKNDGPSYIGELTVADISIPRELLR